MLHVTKGPNRHETSAEELQMQDPSEQRTIEMPSVMSLFITMRYNGHDVASGTGFVAQSPSGRHVLLTARHNLTGRHAETGEVLSDFGTRPDELVVYHNASKRRHQFGKWKRCHESLLDKNNKPLWYEHPQLGNRADFAALPLTDTHGVQLYPYSLDERDRNAEVLIAPAEPISVVGFPFGEGVGGHYAVWATGFVASEPAIDYNDLPIILIDCRTRRGHSGSPVIAYRSGFAVTQGRGTMHGEACMMTLLGLYTGRIKEEKSQQATMRPTTDIGLVWKCGALKELVESIEA
jgi:hypothetical protein